MPLGLVPLKTDNAAPGAPAGAGAGNESTSPAGFRLVGLYVPDGDPSIMADAAASSNVKLRRDSPSTSDISMTDCPAGPTRRRSLSVEWLLVYELSETVTPWTVPRPPTAIVEGYG